MSSKRSGKSRIWLLLAIILVGCGQNNGAGIKPSATTSVTESPFASQAEPTTQSITPTAFPEAFNPLTGLKVADPSLLELPAVLVSISTFPVTARPQAGPSFAPYVFEIYITEGTTRYLTTFYGEFPAPEVAVTGGCAVRTEPFVQTDLIIGNRVWLDVNQNNIQDDWERGVGGVCVNLYDENRNLLQQTSTDSNGYYGFNVSAGNYFVAFAKPEGMEFAQKDAGEDAKDSDLDPTSGWSDALDITVSLPNLDVGLILLNQPVPTSELPPARVGPVRSGRLVYADIADFFEGSC
ncbi:MAG: hypothetical protein HGA30_05820, partial [Anaerolineales bacterium]|nr:hypothetical protein [Anaerolineales bacterium]